MSAPVPLDYMVARYYSSSLGRFMAVDPGTSSVRAMNPQSWNRYVYGANNPITFIDLNGEEPSASYHAWQGANAHERALAASDRAHYEAGRTMYTQVRVQARAATQARFGTIGNGQDTPNAYLHAMLGCLGAQQVGPAMALEFLTAHETGDRRNTPALMAMDMHNNLVGLSLGSDPENFGICSEVVGTALEKDELQESQTDTSVDVAVAPPDTGGVCQSQPRDPKEIQEMQKALVENQRIKNRGRGEN